MIITNQNDRRLPPTTATLPPLRCLSERVIQTLSYEIGGLFLVTPLYALIFKSTAQESLLLMIALSVMVMTWAPLFNFIFDCVEGRLTLRSASERPHALRLLHAILLEVTAVIFTLPVVMVLGGHTFWSALVIDIGLTLAYMAYAYLFHLSFDKLRPVTKGS